MPFLAILIDVVAVLNYFVQLHFQEPFLYWIGIILQVVITFPLLIMTFSYKGRRRVRWAWPGNFTATFSYSIILMSFILNAIAILLYAFNLMGNGVIFGK